MGTRLPGKTLFANLEEGESVQQINNVEKAWHSKRIGWQEHFDPFALGKKNGSYKNHLFLGKINNPIMKSIKTLCIAYLLLLTSNLNAQNNVCFTIHSNPHSAINGLQVFTKYIEVFGVKIFATSGVPDAAIKHCAAVMAEYLDNDEDAEVDNQAVVNELVANNASMVLFSTDGSQDQNTFFTDYDGDWQLQDLFADETHPSGSSSANGFDATLEEVLHLITHVGYAGAYPLVWAENNGSEVADAMDTARGGFFATIPPSYPSQSWYHYDDTSCDYSCMITEYVYWSLTSLLGAQNYPGRCDEITEEWELCTPAQFQNTDTTLFRLLTDATYKFATSIPDGNYCPSTTSLINRNNRNFEVNIFPNPSNKFLTIETSNNHNELFSIVDATGKIIKTGKLNGLSTTINVQNFSAGIYFVKIGTSIIRKGVIIK